MTLLSRRTVLLAGLPVHVFSEKDLGDISGKVAVLFLLHGRQGSAREIGKRAESIVHHVAAKGPSAVTLLVVTIVRQNDCESRQSLKVVCRIRETTGNGSTTL